MTTVLLADGYEIDARLWFYLIVAALSVIGGLLGKKKKEEAERAKREASKGRAPKTRPPAPPRGTQVPRPPRPKPTHPQARPRPTRPPAHPVEARPSPVRPRHVARRAVLIEPGPLAVESLEVDVTTEAITTLSSPDKPVGPARPSRGRENRHTRRLLRSRTGLRTAFILSEILAPPVALRDNQRIC